MKNNSKYLICSNLKIRTLVFLMFIFCFSTQSKAQEIQNLIDTLQKIQSNEAKIPFLKQIANQYFQQSAYQKSIEYYEKTYQIEQKAKLNTDKTLQAMVNVSLAMKD